MMDDDPFDGEGMLELYLNYSLNNKILVRANLEQQPTKILSSVKRVENLGSTDCPSLSK